jgi:hypothetical protein
VQQSRRFVLRSDVQSCYASITPPTACVAVAKCALSMAVARKCIPRTMIPDPRGKLVWNEAEHQTERGFLPPSKSSKACFRGATLGRSRPGAPSRWPAMLDGRRVKDPRHQNPGRLQQMHDGDLQTAEAPSHALQKNWTTLPRGEHNRSA